MENDILHMLADLDLDNAKVETVCGASVKWGEHSAAVTQWNRVTCIPCLNRKEIIESQVEQAVKERVGDGNI